MGSQRLTALFQHTQIVRAENRQIENQVANEQEQQDGQIKKAEIVGPSNSWKILASNNFMSRVQLKLYFGDCYYGGPWISHALHNTQCENEMVATNLHLPIIFRFCRLLKKYRRHG